MANRKRAANGALVATAPEDEPLPPNPVSLAERLGLPPKEEATRAAREAIKRAPSVPITLRVPERGLERAKLIAEKKGLPYQTYLKMLIHEGLERDKALLAK